MPVFNSNLDIYKATLIDKNNLIKFVREILPVRLSNTLLAQFIKHLLNTCFSSEIITLITTGANINRFYAK
jgi:hypothetical protein